MEIKAVIAGLFFGIWPILIQKSGLSGNTASFAWAIGVALCVAPFALTNVGDISNVRWAFVVGAGITGAIGILCLNGAIVQTNYSAKAIGTVLLLMIGAQTVLSAAYGIIASGGKISAIKLAGFVLVSTGAILLTLKEKEA